MWQNLHDELCIIASYLPLHQIPQVLLINKHTLQQISKQDFSYLMAQIGEKVAHSKLLTHDSNYFHVHKNVTSSRDLIKFFAAFDRGFEATKKQLNDGADKLYALLGKTVMWDACANAEGFFPFKLRIPHFSQAVRLQMELRKENDDVVGRVRVGVCNLIKNADNANLDTGCAYSDNGYLHDYDTKSETGWKVGYKEANRVLVQYDTATCKCHFYNDTTLQGELTLQVKENSETYFFANVREVSTPITITRVYMEYA